MVGRLKPPLVSPCVSQKNMEKNLSGLSAELLVASMMVRDGWNIYSPHRDIGFDLIATKNIRGILLFRPIQVRGCYLESKTKETNAYGKSKMELKEIHEEMALVIPYYEPDQTSPYPVYVAFLPHAEIRKHKNRDLYYAGPARARKGAIHMRKEYVRYFGMSGVRLMSDPNWKNLKVRQS